MGLPAEALTFSALALVTGELRIMATAVGTRDDPRATLELGATGKLRCRTETMPLERVNEALDKMRRGTITGRVVLTLE